jgi:tRNA U34 5-carboxymethylaminomethyl modifying GTPase MnmE/TrmE
MKTKANKINIFIELSIESFETDNESVYEELGVLKADYLNDKLKMIKQMKLKSISQLNKAKNERLIEIALQKVQGMIKSTNENIKEGLEQLIHKRSPQFQFRNIEKLDTTDLKELLSDLNLIEMIEDLEKLNDGNK